jgi:hypothetical protein
MSEEVSHSYGDKSRNNSENCRWPRDVFKKTPRELYFRRACELTEGPTDAKELLPGSLCESAVCYEKASIGSKLKACDAPPCWSSVPLPNFDSVSNVLPAYIRPPRYLQKPHQLEKAPFREWNHSLLMCSTWARKITSLQYWREAQIRIPGSQYFSSFLVVNPPISLSA